MRTSLAIRLALLLSVAGAAAAAHAQYVWLDEHGVKQYSDQAPPPDVPQKRILKEPGQAASGISPESDDSSSDNAEKAPKTLEERNADFIKRHAEQAEQEKKAAEQAKQEAAKAQNCAHAREYQNNLASGMRIATTDENGERSFMSDEQRAHEESETQRMLQDCK